MSDLALNYGDMRAWIAWSAVLVLVSAGTATAQGKSKRRSGKTPNMPPGWVWPPSADMRRAGKKCLARLDELGIVYEKASAAKKINTPIVVPSMTFGGVKLTPIFRKPPFVMDCHFAQAFAEQGELLYRAGVRELRFSTIHNYRHVRLGGKTLAALSRHALGLAVDVYEFVLEDDQRVVVKSDYQNGGLYGIEQAAWESGGFRALLTPGNDPRSHFDHFHFEAKMQLPSARADRGNPLKLSRRGAKARVHRSRHKRDASTGKRGDKAPRETKEGLAKKSDHRRDT